MAEMAKRALSGVENVVYPVCEKTGRYIIYAFVFLNDDGSYNQYVGQTDRISVRFYEHKRDSGYACDTAYKNYWKYRETLLYTKIHQYGGWEEVCSKRNGHYEIIERTDCPAMATELEDKYIKAVDVAYRMNRRGSAMRSRTETKVSSYK